MMTTLIILILAAVALYCVFVFRKEEQSQPHEHFIAQFQAIVNHEAAAPLEIIDHGISDVENAVKGAQDKMNCLLGIRNASVIKAQAELVALQSKHADELTQAQTLIADARAAALDAQNSVAQLRTALSGQS